MDNVAETIEEAVDAPIEVQESHEESAPNNKPEGWDQVEFTPEQQQRFNRVYGQVKFLEKDIGQYRTIAQQQAALIEELRQSQSSVINHLHQEDFSRAEASIVQSQKEAYERGDLDAFNKATTQLNQMIVRKELAAQQRQAAPQEQPIAAMDVVSEAIQEGHITYDDADAFKAWAGETDQSGNHKRPWINKQDIRNSTAAIEGAAVFNNPQYARLTFAQKLQEIDRRMGLQTKSPSQTVMSGGGNLTPRAKSPTIKLSPQIEKVATRTKFAGPGKSDAEHIAAYAKQLSEAKGSRR